MIPSHLSLGTVMKFAICQIRCHVPCWLFSLILLGSPAGVELVQAQKAAVGYDDLVAKYGSSLEDGTGIKVAMAEANTGNANNGVYNYLPNSSAAQFSGKVIHDGSGQSTGSSGHATTVGQLFFGNTFSMTGGITDITGYNASHWINDIMGTGTGAAPADQDFRVYNHSWVARGGSSDSIPVPVAENVMQRLDFFINQTGATVVVGADNQATLPLLLTQGYNSISVGRTSGSHSYGPTTIYGNGRIKPDLVAPLGSTSSATAFVSSAAALLHHKADNMGSAHAAQPETVKAILMAGATKDEFSGWNRTQTRPLDTRFGAGELNIYNSYHIMQGGEFDGVAGQPTTNIGAYGWDYEASLGAGSSLYYQFEVNAWEATDLSFLLTWNMEVTDLDPGSAFNPSYRLADLQLALYNSTTSFLGTQIDLSQSPVDNVEHIYLDWLAAGTYTIEVRNWSSFSTDYALAWRMQAIPEPSSLLMLALTIVGIGMRRHRLT